MKKLVLAALAVTMIAGTAAAGNSAHVSVSNGKLDVKASSPAASAKVNSISLNSNVAGGIYNENKGFYAVNTNNIGPVTSRLDIESAAVHLSKIRAGKGDLNISFAESLAVGANVSIDKSTVKYEEISPLKLILPIFVPRGPDAD